MIGIVAIGELACNVADSMSTNVLTLCAKNNQKLKKNMEQWEEDGPLFSIPEKWSDVTEVYCIICGYDAIAGASLVTLSQFQNKKLTIFYLTKSFLSKEEQINNKICINVLQEYTRSGVFEHMFLFDVESMLESLLDTPEIAENKSLLDLHKIVVGKICMCLYIYRQIRHDTLADGNIFDFSDTIYRISSFFEVKDFQNEKFELFYPQFKFAKCYNYVLILPKSMSKNDIQLVKLLKLKMRDNTEQRENNVSIFQEEDDSYRSLIGFCSSNVIQQSIYI